MKHTTFETQLQEIRRRAIQELKEALAAHNGKFDFTKIYPPIIENGKVCQAEISDGKVFISTEETYFRTDELTIEDILLITKFIPETVEVKDVSGVYPAPVTWVDRDDIESAGYDSEKVTQEQLNKIAESMGFGYVDSGEFYSSLSAVCGTIGLEEKED